MTSVIAFAAIVAFVLDAVAVGRMMHTPWLLALALALVLVLQAFVMLVMSRRKVRVRA